MAAHEKPLMDDQQPYTVLATPAGSIIPAQTTPWSQDLFEDFGYGCRYTFFPCCCGAPSAVAKIDAALSE